MASLRASFESSMAIRAPWRNTAIGLSRRRRPLLARHLVAQLDEPGPDLPHRGEAKRREVDPARQQRPARPKGHGADLDDQFVEQPGIVKLADQLATADQPDVLAARRRRHLLVDRPHVAPYEADVRAGDAGQYPVREHPRRLSVRPRRAGSVAGFHDMAEHPFVGRRPHGEGTDLADEGWIARVV